MSLGANNQAAKGGDGAGVGHFGRHHASGRLRRQERHEIGVAMPFTAYRRKPLGAIA
jgi:hypothetical protein